MNSNNKYFFTTYIIDASRYRKLKPLRYTLYFILLIPSVFVVSIPAGTQIYIEYINRWVTIQPLLLYTWIAVGVFTLLIYVYSRMNKFLGKVSINKAQIRIDHGVKVEHYLLDDITDLTFTRGATFHYDYKRHRNKLTHYVQTVNNWISFKTEKGERIKIEFLINTHAQNSSFEELMKKLKEAGCEFEYFTI